MWSQSRPTFDALTSDYTLEQVEAGDFPEGATAKGYSMDPDDALWGFEGVSIFDEYAPDQLGAVPRGAVLVTR